MLNASHTHSGPVLRGALYDAYPIDKRVEIGRIEAYSAELEQTIVHTVGEALSRCGPRQPEPRGRFDGFCRQSAEQSRGRRPPAPRAQHALRGPSDHSVPVLAVRGPDGKLLAVCSLTPVTIRRSASSNGTAITPVSRRPILKRPIRVAVALFVHGLRSGPESHPTAHGRVGPQLWADDFRTPSRSCWRGRWNRCPPSADRICDRCRSSWGPFPRGRS